MKWQWEIHGGKDQRSMHMTQFLSYFNYSTLLATAWILTVIIALNCFYPYNQYPYLDHWLMIGTVSNTEAEIQKVTEKTINSNNSAYSPQDDL